MKKFLCVFLILCSCGSKGTDVVTLPTENLIATTGPIPAALIHKLTPDDIQRLKRHYPQTLRKIQEYQPLTLQDIINMTRAGISDDTMIHEMRATRSTFYLTPQNEQTLLQAGVSRRILNEMMDTTDNHY